jgi:hypothetical protein
MQLIKTEKCKGLQSGALKLIQKGYSIISKKEKKDVSW